MKIKPSDYKELSDALTKVMYRLSKEEIAEHIELLKDNKMIKDPLMAFRWNVFSAAFNQTEGLLNKLYAYLSDDHIDTALKYYFKH